MKQRRTLALAGVASIALLSGISPSSGQYMPPPIINGVDWSVPNYANSPIIRKFVDTLPGLGPTGANALGNYISVAVADTNTFTGSDYYEIAVVDYTQQLHPDLGPTKLRGYVQLETPAVLARMALMGLTSKSYPLPGGKLGVDQPRYLGPTIVATKGVATRIKFYNLLPPGTAGDLFIPTDATIMGAGDGPLPDPAGPAGTMLQYSQNRATLHLHGSDNPWISDGTAHQWITPAGQTGYTNGVSQQNVPDMMPLPVAGDGTATFYWPNGLSGRLMFYHDHAFGITRLNVYAGEAAGYLLVDPSERLINSLVATEIPLVIQDKGFVNDGTTPVGYPPTAPVPLATTDANADPRWAIDGPGKWGQTQGSLWLPHVYIPNQNPADLSGANPFGRWDYGAWFWPIFPSGLPPVVSAVPEAFMDTPLVNGAPYPVLNVNPAAYRLRVLNACNDRYVNLQLYVATSIVDTVTLTAPGAGYTAPFVTITDPNPAARGATATAIVEGIISAITIVNPGAGYTAPAVTITDPTGTGATASATIDATGAITAITVLTPGTGYTAPVVTITDPAIVTIAAAATATVQGIIAGITLDTVGSGYTAPVVTITDPTGTGATATATAYTAPTEVGMVPAVKSALAWPSWWTMNDTPGMIPNILDQRQGGVPDPATMGPSFLHIGSEGGISPAVVELKNTPMGYEQNKRSVTVLNTFDHTVFLGPAERADLVVDFSAFAGKTLILYNDSPAPVPAGDPRYDYYTGHPDYTVQGGSPATLPGFGPNTRTIMQIKVAAGTAAPLNRAALNTAVATAYQAQPAAIVPPATYARISDTSMTYGGKTIPLQPKTIQELFDPLGRMNSTLGVEMPFTTAAVQTTIPYGFADPATEVMLDGDTQLWKITHNGVDTHAIHFHLFNVQVVNRIGWDGAIKPPWPEEMGWKETVKMNPLEDIVVALQAKNPTVPFRQPNNVRALAPELPLGTANAPGAITPFFGQDPAGNPVAVSNVVANFGNEYTWHCHLLGHEENDMMRPILVAVKPAPPGTPTLTVSKGKMVLTWTDTSPDETGYMVQKKVGNGPWVTIGTVKTATYTDSTWKSNQGAQYQIIAVNTVGSGVPGYPSVTAYSLPSGVAAAPLGATVITSVTQALAVGSPVVVKWTYSATDQTGFRIERSTSNTFPANSTTTFTVGNVLTYSDTTVVVGLRRNTTYYYRVTPTNSNGSGNPSNNGTLLVHP